MDLNDTNPTPDLEEQLEFDSASSSAPEGGEAAYIEDDIKTLDWREHIRLRPGM